VCWRAFVNTEKNLRVFMIAGNFLIYCVDNSCLTKAVCCGDIIS
jgi:hypothetical protein